MSKINNTKKDIFVTFKKDRSYSDEIFRELSQRSKSKLKQLKEND